jgi:hypothetical protein
MTKRASLLIAAATLAAALGSASGPGMAATVGYAPWCAVQDLGTGDVVWDCEFQSAEQCAPQVVAGNRGFCNLNPSWPPYQPVPPPPHHRRHHHG